MAIYCAEPVRPAAKLLSAEPTFLQSLAVDMFKNLGFTVLDAYNGHHALALLEARPEISLMFVDVRMPGMSGLELAKVVHKRCPNIKIILTSGYVGEDVVPSGLNFVPKPW